MGVFEVIIDEAPIYAWQWWDSFCDWTPVVIRDNRPDNPICDADDLHEGNFHYVLEWSMQSCDMVASMSFGNRGDRKQAEKVHKIVLLWRDQ